MLNGLTDNLTSFEIASKLTELGDSRKIQRRLARWNIQKRTIDTKQLRIRIIALFFDKEMLKALHAGHQIELV